MTSERDGTGKLAPLEARFAALESVRQGYGTWPADRTFPWSDEECAAALRGHQVRWPYRGARGTPPYRWVSDAPANKAAYPVRRRRCTTKHRRDDDKGIYSMSRRRHAPTKSFEQTF
jgi:hypothetical protein